MENIKMCKNCMWCDECGSKGLQVCEHYYNEADEEIDAINTYEEDLALRHGLYGEQVEEQND